MPPLSRFFCGRIPARLFVFCAPLFSACLFVAPPPAVAATNVVESLNDNGPFSLRDAVSNAAPGDTVVFAVSGLIALTNGSVVIGGNISIVGPGSTNLAVDAGRHSRVFTILSNLNVSISGLTISGGLARSEAGEPAAGGGIYNAGFLRLDNCSIIGNNSGNGGAAGGGIYNLLSLAMCHCTVCSNRTAMGDFGKDGGDGGAVWNGGNCAMDHCILAGNVTGGGGSGSGSYYYGASGYEGGAGGALCNQCTASLTCCTVSSNTTGNGGYGSGGYFLSGGGGVGGCGGAIFSCSNLTLLNCAFVGNQAGNGGQGGTGQAPSSDRRPRRAGGRHLCE